MKSRYIEMIESGKPVLLKEALRVILKNLDPEGIPLLEKLCRRNLKDEFYYLARKSLDILRTRLLPVPYQSEDLPAVKADQLPELLAAKQAWKRIRGVRAVMTQGLSDFLPQLKEMALNEKDPFVISSLVKALGLLGKGHAVPIIAGFLNHTDIRVRANAVEALQMTGSAMTAGMIVPLLEDPSHRVRVTAARFLTGMAGTDTLRPVREMLALGQPWLLESAFYYLQQTRNSDEDIRNRLCRIQQSAANDALRQKSSEVLRLLSVRQLNKLTGSITVDQADELKILNRKLAEKKTVEKADKLCRSVKDLPKTMLEKLIYQARFGTFSEKRKAVLEMLRVPRKEYSPVLEVLSQDQSPVISYFARKALSGGT